MLPKPKPIPLTPEQQRLASLIRGDVVGADSYFCFEKLRRVTRLHKRNKLK